jgi:hypothetical protein
LTPFAVRLLLVGLAALCLASPPASAQSRGSDATAKLGQFNSPPPPPPLPPPPPPGTAPPPGAEGQQGNSALPRRRWRDMIDALLDMLAPRTLLLRRWVDDPLTTGFNNPDLVEPVADRGGA